MNELIDSVTGQPFEPRGDKATGAALVSLVGSASFDTSELSAEATQESVLAQLQALGVQLQTMINDLELTPPYLPPTPLMAPGDYTPFVLDSTSNTDILIAAAAGAGIKTRVYRALFTIGGATTIRIYDDASASGIMLARYDYPASGGVMDFESLRGRWKSQANKPLVLKQTGGAQLSGTIDYAQSSAA